MVIELRVSPREVVEGPGSFAIRGGIVDIWSPEAEFPIRIELFGDEIDSLRPFSAESQRAHEEVQEARILPVHDAADDAPSVRLWPIISGAMVGLFWWNPLKSGDKPKALATALQPRRARYRRAKLLPR